jgi:hypothetical protein
VKVANGQKEKVKGQGKVILPVGNNEYEIELPIGLLVPGCNTTLVSVSQLAKHPDTKEVIFNENGCYLQLHSQNERIKIGNESNGLYELN